MCLQQHWYIFCNFALDKQMRDASYYERSFRYGSLSHHTVS